jgi:hypothetical protein
LVAAAASACTVLIFCMLLVQNVAGFVSFNVLFGLASGTCAWRLPLVESSCSILSSFESDISLLAPTAALLANDVTEIGARMGIAYAFTGEHS